LGFTELALPLRAGHATAALLALVVLVLVPGSAGAATSFAPGLSSPYALSPATTPHDIAVGDGDRNGSPDLATANNGSDDVSVLLRNPGGGYTLAGLTGGAGTNPEALVIVDLNRDGYLDVATANNSSHDVSILLNNHLGGLVAQSPIATGGNNPNDIVTADFDRDGKPDLATANFSSGTVSVLRGNGSGGFVQATGSPYAAGATPAGLAVADFNRDSKPDLVAVNEEAVGHVNVLLGTGTVGAMAPATEVVTKGINGTSVVVGDFNRDGWPDAATANFSDDVSVMLNNGSGALTAPAAAIDAGTGNPSANPQGIASADFDGDGNPDLATANTGADSVSVLRGNGSGGFTPDPPVGVGDAPWAVLAHDLSGDGRPDLATANSGASSVTVLNNTTDFQPKNYYAAPAQIAAAPPKDVELGDFNRDGDLDIALAPFGGNPNNVGVRLNDGSGGFPSSVPYGAGTGPGNEASGVTSADFDRDGDLDLAVTNNGNNTVVILTNNGSGIFAAFGAPISIGAASIGIAHLDVGRDGDEDLVVATSSNSVVLTNDGAGNFPGSPALPGGSEGRRVVAADLNRDGAPDLALTSQSADSVHQILSDGGSGFLSVGDLSVGAFPAGIVSADLDRNGGPDLVNANRDSDTVSVQLNQLDDPPSYALTQPAVGDGPLDVDAQDLDGNGTVDLAVANSLSQNISVLRGKPGGGYEPQVTFADDPGTTPGAIAAGDLNGDGDPDLVTSQSVLLSLRDGVVPSTFDDVPVTPRNAPRAVTLVPGDGGGSGILNTYYEKGPAPATPTTSSAVYNPAAKPVLAGGESIRYFTEDRAGNKEPAKSSAPMIVDAAVPAPPSGLATNPISPANNNSPRVTGNAEPGSTVTLHSGACNGPVAATGTSGQFASPGLSVSVLDNTTTQFFATATDAASNTSACSAPVTYEERTAAPPPPPTPKKTANVEAKSGEVIVKCPGKAESTIDAKTQIKAGCRVDATDGVVALTAAADTKGKTQSADFFDGAFKFKQVEETELVKKKKVKALITELALDVAKPTGCKTKKSSIAGARRRGHLWGRGKGRYRTRGRRGAGTVRGTEWLTEERCEGTYFQVKTGVVEVQDFTLKKTVLVKKGKHYLAPATKPKKKG
jgi:hypothetical protein